MCIAVFMWKAHPVYPFFLLLNRDEYYNRATTPLGWWSKEEEKEGIQILGGRDEVAGGTWLASTKNGRIAFLTNVRESQKLHHPNSRGHLPLRYLKSNKSPQEFADQLIGDGEGDRYNGFNLIVADMCCMSMIYITNRPKHHEHGLSVTEVPPGIHVLSNAMLDTPWPKAQRLEHAFKDVLDKYSNAELPVKEMAETIMMDTTKDDDSKLPHIYSPETEYQLSSIFVEAGTPMGVYGTRSTSGLAVKVTGEARFYERYIENSVWKEQEVNYWIE